MKFLQLSIIFLLFNSTISIAQKHFSSDKIRNDLLFLKNRFDAMHPGLYRYTTKTSYDSLYAHLYANAEQSMTFQQAFRYVAPLVTAVKDGHTSYRFPKKYYGKKPKMIPIYVRAIDEKILLHYNGSADSTMQRGDEIISINNEPIDEIIERLKTTFGTDNDNSTTKKLYTTQSFANFYLKYYGMSDSTKITYKKPTDDTLRVNILANIPSQESIKIVAKRYKNALRKNFDYKILDSTQRIAYLSITSFSMKGNPLDVLQFKFRKMLKKRFKSIKNDKIDYLIVDFKGNGGGFIPNISRFLRYVSPQPFVLTDTLSFKKKAFQKVAPLYSIFPPLVTRLTFKKSEDGNYFYRKPSKPTIYQPKKSNFYSNKLFFLMDGGSYSATTFTLGLAKDLGLGTFIGEQAGGANWGSFAGSWNDFRLPNTKIRIHMPLYKIMHNLPNQRTQTLFLEPDYEIGNNLRYFMERKDPTVEFALDLIRN